MPTLTDLRGLVKELAQKTADLEQGARELEEEGTGVNLEPTKTQNEIKEHARKIVDKKLKPIVRKLDEAAEYPLEFMKELGSLGFLGTYLPEEYGGLGQGALSLILVMEEVAKVCPGTATSVGANALGTYPILLSGTEEQKEKYLPKIASGELFAAFGLTEPDSGSDALAMKSKAVLDGDYYILNGEKQFISSAGRADFYSVFAKTNLQRGSRGVSGFIVEKDSPGLSFGKKEIKMGLNCSETRSLFFENCMVPKENLIGGKEGIGAIILLNTLNHSRIVVSSQGLGLAEGSFARALEYAKERKQFGQSIINFQSIQHDFAEMALKIECARGLVYQAAWYADNHYPKDKIAKFGAMAKLYASRIACEVARSALEICGGMGFMRDFGMEKYLRDSTAIPLYEGTSNIQKNEIAQILLKESHQK